MASAAIDRAVAHWLSVRALLPRERAAGAVANLNLGEFVRLAFPRCRAYRKQLWIARYTAWLYLVDDRLEDLVAAGARAEARALIDGMLAASERHPSEPGHPFERAFAYLTNQLLCFCEPGFYPRWRNAHRRYWLRGVLRESHRERGRSQALHACLARKPCVTALEVYFELVQGLMGLCVPETPDAEAPMSALRALGALIDGLFNDILSLERERHRATHSNVALWLVPRTASDRIAIERVVALHNDLVRDFDALARRTEAHLARDLPDLPSLLTHLRHMLSGLAVWQLSTGRYGDHAPISVVEDCDTPHRPVLTGPHIALADAATSRLLE